MASTYSDLKIELIGTGDQTGTWGTTTNNNFSVALSEAITGSADVAFSSADVTVTLTDTNAAQTARNLRLNLTGTSGGARQLILGSNCQIEKLYLVNNGLADAVTVKNTSGTGIVVAAGTSMFVYNNGTNVVNAVIASPVASGGTGLSTLTANNVLIGNGTSNVSFVAPSTSGNVLTSNGTTWTSSVPAAGGVSYTSVKTANYTAANNEGVLTNTTGGAFTVTLPTSPAVGNIIIVVDSFGQWGTNNLTIDPTASIKIAGDTAGTTLICDITGATVTLVYTGATYGWNVSAQVGGNGGTVMTLTDVQTVTGTKTFSGTSSTLAMILNDAAEVTTVSATAATGTINYDVTTQSVLYYTSNASANFTVNFRASSGTSLNTAMTTGQSVTAAFLVTQGATAYYNNVVQVDGSTVTPKYQGGTAPAAGNASSVDVYMYTIVKTGNAAFTVFASQTKFA